MRPLIHRARLARGLYAESRIAVAFAAEQPLQIAEIDLAPTRKGKCVLEVWLRSIEVSLIAAGHAGSVT